MTDIDHPSTFILEELQERGWTLDDLARRMSTDHIAENRLILDMYFEVGPTNTNLRIGSDTASEIAKAFGISAAYFVRLENKWLEARDKAND